MKEMIACCGLLCYDCPARIATINDDDALRQKTAAQWSKLYNTTLVASDINCVGCIVTEGPHFGHCAECQVRNCAMEHQVPNCAACNEYPCEIISGFVAMVPEAKATLDALLT